MTDTGALIEEIRRALAEDPDVGQLDVEVSLRGNRALITGYAVTDERRDRITAVVGRLLPGYEVQNSSVTGGLPEPGDSEEVLT